MNVRISRRSLFTTAAGAIGGGAWSLGFLRVTRVASPQIEVIGIDDTQLVLLDTTAERILIVVGPYNSYILDALGDLLGALRHRIDILIATESALHAGAHSIRDRRNVGRTLAMPEIGSTLSPTANAAMTQPVEIALSERVSLRCIPHFRYAQSQIGTDPGWRIEVRRGTQVVGFAHSLDTLSSVPAGPYALAIAPVGSVKLAQRKSLAMAYAVNEGEVDPAVTSVIQVRIFSGDVARFVIGQESTTLPGWATVALRSS